MRFTQVSNSRLNEILLVRNQKTSGNWPLRDVRFWIFLAKKGLQFSGINGNIPSLTVNKHQSTGKPLNKGISVLLFNLECCMELSFQ